MTTAAVEVSAALGATSPLAGRGPVVASPGNGEAFNKVLNELTAKTLDDAALDKRDATTKPTKRSRTTGASTPAAPASSLEATRAAEIHGTSDTETLPRPSDEKADAPAPSALATTNEELVGSWNVPSHAEVVAATPAPVGDEHAGSAIEDAVHAPSTVVDATTSYLSAVPAAPTERLTIETKENDASADEKVSAALEASVTTASSVGVTPSATTAVAASTLSAASAAIRRALPVIAGSAPSRSSASRSEQSTFTPADTEASISRHAEGVSGSSDKTYSDLIVGPNVASNVRATMSAAPTVSSSTPSASSLDVGDLASSISQATLGSDGSYTINVAMHPSDLGHVLAVVSLNGADLHVAITPQTPTGHAALATAVESLKSELSRSGLNVNVSLRDPESRSGRGNDDAQRAVPLGVDPPTAESDASGVTESLSVSQIHLIL